MGTGPDPVTSLLSIGATCSVDMGDDPSGGGERIEDGRPLRAVGVALGLTVAGLAASIAGGVALAIPVLLYDLRLGDPGVLVALTAAGQLGFLAVAVAYARYAGLRVRIEVPDRRDLGYALGGVVAGLLLAVVLSVVLAVLELAPGSVIEEAGVRDPTLFVGLAVLSVLVVAPAEEFLFRGVIQARLRQAFGPVAAVAGASLLFGSLHLANYTGTAGPIVAGALVVAAIGAVFGILYERTDNLAVPILAHGAYNFLLFALAYLTV